MDERWVVLLNYWQKNEFRHALTFPFLIGALRIPIGIAHNKNGGAQKEIEELVNVMCMHSAHGYYHHVYRCPDLSQLVVTKVVDSSPPPSAIPIRPAKLNVPPSLYASDGVKPNSTSPLSSLVEAIWKEVGPYVEEGHFSCRGKKFGVFNEDELRVIRSAFG